MKKLDDAVRTILDNFKGGWEDDEELKDTPKRVRKAYEELLEKKEVKLTSFPTTYSGLIIRANIPFVSLCPHHLLPYKGKIHFAYLPHKRKLGISKIVRFMMENSKSLLPQEELTDYLINSFMEAVKPRGAMIIIIGYHSCEEIRGVRVAGVPTITSAIRGEFEKKDSTLKQEVIELLKIAGVDNHV